MRPSRYASSAANDGDDLRKSLQKALDDESTSPAEKKRIRRALASLDESDGKPNSGAGSAFAGMTAQELLKLSATYAAIAAHHRGELPGQSQAPSVDAQQQTRLDRAFGIQPEGTTVGVRVTGAIQEFGVEMLPAASKQNPHILQAAQRTATATPKSAQELDEIDRRLGITKAAPSGVRMIGNRQTFSA